MWSALEPGAFASVFAISSRGNMALKQVADPTRSMELEKEFTDLKALETLGHDMFAFQTHMGLN